MKIDALNFADCGHVLPPLSDSDAVQINAAGIIRPERGSLVSLSTVLMDLRLSTEYGKYLLDG